MRILLSFLVALSALAAIPTSTALLPAAVGQAAPDFTLPDNEGKTHSLSSLKGKFVVLEWVNYDCPFVRAQYHSGSMPELQRIYTEKGVVWLSICSSAPGNDGYFRGNELKSRMEQLKAVPGAYLVDAQGDVGRLYAAKSTPTMFVVDPRGTLIYAGGIDDTPTTNPTEVTHSRNYVREALDLAMSGKPVEVTYSRSYGCSVKY
jgi:hypothetical protein